MIVKLINLAATAIIKFFNKKGIQNGIAHGREGLCQKMVPEVVQYYTGDQWWFWQGVFGVRKYSSSEHVAV